MFTFIKNLFGSPSFEQQMEKQMNVFVKINKGLTILKEKAISEKQKKPCRNDKIICKKFSH